MNNFDKLVNLPGKLSGKERGILDKLDVAETIDSWAVKLGRENLHAQTVIDWNSHREAFAIHPSSVTNPCDYYLYLQAVGESSDRSLPPKMQKIYDSGTALHAQLQYYMVSAAKNNGFSYTPEIGFSPKDSPTTFNLRVAGHADGISKGWPLKNRAVVWEFKTVNKNGLVRLTKPESKYIKQVHLYMMALNAPVTYVVYICKDNSEILPFMVPFDKSVAEPIIERLLRIRKCAYNLEDPEKRIASSCRYCEFGSQCSPDLSSVRGRGRIPKRI